MVDSSKDSTQIIRRKFEDGNPTATEALLVPDTLIRSDEEIELFLGQAQEFAVFDAFPTTITYRYALVGDEAVAHWERAFPEQTFRFR